MLKEKDYISNPYFANRLAQRIAHYYHKRGYPGVKTWIEEQKVPESKRPIFVIRSNLKFSV